MDGRVLADLGRSSQPHRFSKGKDHITAEQVMIIRSSVAVVAGVAANMLAIPVDATLQSAGVFSAAGEAPYVLALAYRVAFAALGGWITARLAPSSPMKHGWILGVVGVVFASLGSAAQWSAGHHWYPLAIVVLSLPATLAGARRFVRSRP